MPVAIMVPNRQPRRMRPFTGSVDELYNMIYSMENQVRELEGTAVFTQLTSEQKQKLARLKAELQYLYTMRDKPENGYTISFGTCGVGITNPNTLNFPDYDESLIINDQQAKAEARNQFRNNIKNLFEQYLYAMFQGRVTSQGLSFDKYQYQWNLFQQRYSNNPSLTIIYPITSFDPDLHIPSNPEAYNPNETSLGGADYDKMSDPESPEGGVISTINPYVDPDKYVYNGTTEAEGKPPVLGGGSSSTDIVGGGGGGTNTDIAGGSQGNDIPDLPDIKSQTATAGLTIKPLYLIIAGAALIFLLTRKSK